MAKLAGTEAWMPNACGAESSEYIHPLEQLNEVIMSPEKNIALHLPAERKVVSRMKPEVMTTKGLRGCGGLGIFVWD